MIIEAPAIRPRTAEPVTTDPRPLLDVEGLSIDLLIAGRPRRIVEDVTFRAYKGKTLCILGESGSGKSLTLRALMRLLPPGATVGGRVRIEGEDLMAYAPRALRRMRGPVVSMIFQEPASALDPAYTIGEQIIETIRAHEAISRRDARRRALDLLERVRVPSPDRRLEAYPHELSGGLRQRAMIAVALSCRPSLLLADEPTTALDPSVQIQVLTLLRDLQQDLGMGIVFVTHDIGVATEIADQVAVMYAGAFVETGAVEPVLSRPAHPYTRGLLNAAVGTTSPGARLKPIPGSPPDPDARPPGCAFAPRCEAAMDACRVARPLLKISNHDRGVRCVLFDATQRADHD